MSWNTQTIDLSKAKSVTANDATPTEAVSLAGSDDVRTSFNMDAVAHLGAGALSVEQAKAIHTQQADRHRRLRHRRRRDRSPRRRLVGGRDRGNVRATNADPAEAVILTGMGDAVDAFTMDSTSYTDLTVDQVKAVEDAKNETSVSYTVLDAAGTIESNISEIDDATAVAATDGDSDGSADLLTLTVAEHDLLDDTDTSLTTGHVIVDTPSAAIAAALNAGEPSVTTATSITTTGGAVSSTIREADALLDSAQTGTVPGDITVTDPVTVAQAGDVLGTTYDVLDTLTAIAQALAHPYWVWIQSDERELRHRDCNGRRGADYCGRPSLRHQRGSC